MRVLRILIALLVIMFLISCRTGREAARKESPFEYDTLFARYPKYRIDNKIQKICVIGSGEGRSQISNFLTSFFMRQTNVKVVEPGNLQAILGGKIIEYSTGLTPSESRALSQMLQIDHILLFEDKVSPHGDYEFGGRATVTVNLKIVNTLSGEVIFQSFHSVGINVKDPRKFGHRNIGEIPTWVANDMRNGCLECLIHELSYAMGRYHMGWLVLDKGTVNNIMMNSVSDKAGIKINDRIVTVTGKEPGEIRQGDLARARIQREGKILEFNLEIPMIPFKIEEKKKDAPTRKDKTM